MPKEQYMCQLCANHGIFNQPKKGHKQKCPHRNCPCPLCALNTKRRALDQIERQLRVSSSTSTSTSSPPSSSSTVSSPTFTPFNYSTSTDKPPVTVTSMPMTMLPFSTSLTSPSCLPFALSCPSAELFDLAQCHRDLAQCQQSDFAQCQRDSTQCQQSDMSSYQQPDLAQCQTGSASCKDPSTSSSASTSPYLGPAFHPCSGILPRASPASTPTRQHTPNRSHRAALSPYAVALPATISRKQMKETLARMEKERTLNSTIENIHRQKSIFHSAEQLAAT